MKLISWTPIAAAILGFSFVTAPVQAAADTATVNVALLDMTSVMGGGMMGMMGSGQGMMGQDWNWNMMGSGQGMMGRGMMGPGWGMMGMGMMSIRVDQATVKAGDIHFAVTNWSRAIVHEVLVVAVENPSAPLPYDYATGKIPEEQVKSMGEVGELKPNESGAMDVELPPGTYLLICNLAGHYAAGMVTPLTVTP